MTNQVENYTGAVDRGLEGVVACSSSISSIVGATLCYRGYTIEDLAAHSNFEEVVYLLWYGKLPSENDFVNFKKSIASEMTLSGHFKELLIEMAKSFPKDAHPMDYLKAAVSVQSFFDPEVNSNEVHANERKAFRLLAKMGPIVANFERLRQGKDFIEPKSDHSIAWNFLYILTGEEPSEKHVKIFDTALVLHADHGLNCSTFTARVTASSLSDLHSAIVSAIGSLKGPLHGGANTAVMETLRQIGSLDKVETFVENALVNKHKIMGIGHRVYKNGDPRAGILKKYSEELTKEAGTEELYQMSEKIEKMVADRKGLLPNVDFYSATVYDALGIKGDLFTPIFAVSRVSGWCAHVFEQYANNRIYRPRLNYTGEKGKTWSDFASRN